MQIDDNKEPSNQDIQKEKSRVMSMNESMVSENHQNNASILSGKNSSHNESGLFFVTNLVRKRFDLFYETYKSIFQRK